MFHGGLTNRQKRYKMIGQNQYKKGSNMIKLFVVIFIVAQLFFANFTWAGEQEEAKVPHALSAINPPPEKISDAEAAKIKSGPMAGPECRRRLDGAIIFTRSGQPVQGPRRTK
jgi:hypothetical protein